MTIRILGVDVGSAKICASMVEYDGKQAKFIALASIKSKGLKKGSITNIELASNSIKAAVSEVLKIAGTNYDKVIVSISGKGILEKDGTYSVNIPDEEVGMTEIKNVVKNAHAKLSFPQDYKLIHSIPYNFRIDEQANSIDDPLGMTGSKLEVKIHGIAVQKTALLNLERAFNNAGFKVDNIVLNSYASSIATLNQDEKDLGVVLIDMGADTCNLALYFGDSIRHADFLPVGSSNITMDLSEALHTSICEADDIKIHLDKLVNNEDEKIVLKDLGDENSSHEVDISIIKNVILARIYETLSILDKMIKDGSTLSKDLGAGVVLTGGMTKLSSIKEFASNMFGTSIRVAKPIRIEGLSEDELDPENSCAIGLCLYGAGYFTPYELDSNEELRFKGEPMNVKNDLFSLDNLKEVDVQKVQVKSEPSLKIEEDGLSMQNEKIATPNMLSKGINWFKHLF